MGDPEIAHSRPQPDLGRRKELRLNTRYVTDDRYKIFRWRTLCEVMPRQSKSGDLIPGY